MKYEIKRKNESYSENATGLIVRVGFAHLSDAEEVVRWHTERDGIERVVISSDSPIFSANLTKDQKEIARSEFAARLRNNFTSPIDT